MKSTRGRIAVVLLALVCLFAAMSYGEREAWDCLECGRKGNTGNFCGTCAHPAPEAGPVYAVGDIITFGHYEQDNNLNNGKEAIEWIVLEYNAEEKKALLLSRYGLDAKPYHAIYKSITWGKCSLRSWLNDEFLRTAFTAEEQHGILKTDVDNGETQGYSGWDTDGGNNTVDQIFLLSYQEVLEDFKNKNQSSTCKPTAYAIARGALTGSENGNCWWWLRSPGRSQRNAASMTDTDTCGSNLVDYDSSSVRPALWLKLDSNLAGKEKNELSAEELYNLGLRYYKGENVKQDYSAAANYIGRAAELGLAEAQGNMGIFYRDGIGVEKDTVQAVRYFQLAADQGYAGGQVNLGYCYEKGIGVEIDALKAVHYYQLAADQGNAAAQNNLGNCYRNGFGVEKDDAKAVHYYHLAADQGDASAQYNLGYCYEHGIGVEKNEQLAQMYYQLAGD